MAIGSLKLLSSNLLENKKIFLFVSDFCTKHQTFLKLNEQWKEWDCQEKRKTFAIALSKMWMCEPSTVEKMLEHNNLSTMQYSFLEKTSILEKYNVNLEIMRQNPHILYYTSAPELERRLKLLRDVNYDSDNEPIRLDILLVLSKKRFSKSLDQISARRIAREGCADKAQYLQQRLCISQDRAKELASSRIIRKISEVKLQRLLDLFLDEMKVSSDFIIKHKKLLEYSVKELRERWELLCCEGSTDNLAAKLSLTNSEFWTRFGYDADVIDILEEPCIVISN